MKKVKKISEVKIQSLFTGYPKLYFSHNFPATENELQLNLYSFGKTTTQFYNTLKIEFKVTEYFLN